MLEPSDTAIIKEKCEDSLRILGLIFEYLSRPALEEYGMKGEQAVREGLRAYGSYRGKLMREWHEEMGFPINVNSVLQYWDSSSALETMNISEVFDDPNAEFTPYYVNHRATNCPLAEVWKEDNWEDYGFWYCDEIHEEVCLAYHPRTHVEIHENLVKGDPFCQFTWIQVPDKTEEEVEVPEEARQKVLKDTIGALKRTVRIAGMLYYFLSESLLKRFGKKGEEMVREATADLGLRRGSELKKKLSKAGKDYTIENLIDNQDLSYDILWEIKEIESNDKYVAEVEYCPLAELWSEVGGEEIGSIYCTETYRNMFRNFSLDAEIKIPSCMTRGDSKCRFEFDL